MRNEKLCILIMLGMFLIQGVSPANSTSAFTRTTTEGNILYVGGNGPGNYTHIQDALDNTTDGDTVYVYSGEYPEHIIISTSINLIGENKQTTIIDDSHQDESVVYITAHNVTIRGFTIGNIDHDIPTRNSGDGIYISDTRYCTVSDNIIQRNNRFGIYIVHSTDTTITNNIITDNFVQENVGFGIKVTAQSQYNSITNNTIINNFCGIDIDESSLNTISDNTIVNNWCGIGIQLISFFNTIINNTIQHNRDCGISCYQYCDHTKILNNTIENQNEHRFSYGIKLFHNQYFGDPPTIPTEILVQGNTIANNTIGISILYTYNNTIQQNNFINNTRHVKNRIEKGYGTNTWSENYWGKPRLLPKLIIGKIRIYNGGIFFQFFLPKIEVDMHPAQQPYPMV